MKLITCIDKNYGIGYKGSLCVSNKEDMQMFKNLTINSTVIMGKNTWESLPKKPLPNRKNLIVSSEINDNYINISDIKNYENDENVWIIGGAQLYEYVLQHKCVTECIINRVDQECLADVYFPVNELKKSYVLYDNVYYDTFVSETWYRRDIYESIKIKKYHKLYMDIAIRISEMSYAKRKKVGCIAVKDGRIISMGWNGTPRGLDNCCEHMVSGKLETKSEVLHAELNCLTKIAKSTETSNDTSLYITLSPCFDCAKLIIQSGITHVYYLNEYRDLRGIELLKQYIHIEKL